MENFEALQSIDNFCKVVIKKQGGDLHKDNRIENETAKKETVERDSAHTPFRTNSVMSDIRQFDFEEPFVDVFDEEEHVRILVQCRCREEQVTFHPSKDGITICREECQKKRNGAEMYRDVCRKLDMRTDELQLENMQFIIAKCNNNNTLEAMIPKIRRQTA